MHMEYVEPIKHNTTKKLAKISSIVGRYAPTLEGNKTAVALLN